MRKVILLSSLIILISQSGYSQTANIYPATGYIGAGTNSPLSKLHISGVGRFGLRLYNDGNTTNYLSLWQGSGGSVIDPIGTGLLYLGYDQSTNVVIGSSGGNLGIGTDSPGSRLEIRGLGNTLGLKIRNNNETEPTYGVTIIQKDDKSGRIQCAGQELQIESGWDKSLILGNIQYSNYGGKVIFPGGNVGIGTSSPNQKLTVNGTIYGKEVKVDLAVPGPDYVFEKEYALPSLESIQTYIDQNKHLPEVPSAKEMEANGINLSEMNMLLLKKVEELTLYLIELKKVNEIQSDEIKRIKDIVIQQK